MGTHKKYIREEFVGHYEYVDELRVARLPCLGCTGFGGYSTMFGLKLIKCMAANAAIPTGIDLVYSIARGCPSIEASDEVFFAYHASYSAPPPDS